MMVAILRVIFKVHGFNSLHNAPKSGLDGNKHKVKSKVRLVNVQRLIRGHESSRMHLGS